MSYTAVIVAEDPTNNGYVLTPLIESMLSACGKPRARVSVLTNPRTTGYEHAKGLLRSGLISRYRFVDLLLFLPDGDGRDRQDEFTDLEKKAATEGTRLLCCAAREEVETWLLAGHVDQLDRPWHQIRSDASVKENVFEPFLAKYGDPRRPGSGRGDLMRSTLKNYAGLKVRCPELADLELRLKNLLATAS
jgi:hypothetical protein